MIPPEAQYWLIDPKEKQFVKARYTAKKQATAARETDLLYSIRAINMP
jgi:hypothetical protein